MKIRRPFTAIAIAALALAGVAIPTAASAAATGTVNVQLVSPNGSPLARQDAQIYLYDKYTGPSPYDSNDQTDASGRTSFTDAPVGVKLTAEFQGDGNDLTYLKTQTHCRRGQEHLCQARRRAGRAAEREAR